MTRSIAPTGEAEIEDKFRITDRGTYLVLKWEGWTGSVTIGDTFQRGTQRSKVRAVESGRRAGSSPPGFVAIAIEDEALAEEITSGDIVQFFASEAAEPD